MDLNSFRNRGLALAALIFLAEVSEDGTLCNRCEDVVNG